MTTRTRSQLPRLLKQLLQQLLLRRWRRAAVMRATVKMRNQQLSQLQLLPKLPRK